MDPNTIRFADAQREKQRQAKLKVRAEQDAAALTERRSEKQKQMKKNEAWWVGSSSPVFQKAWKGKPRVARRRPPWCLS